MKEVLIISAHADDETFGMGATLLKLAKSKEYQISWLICTTIWEPKWNKQAIQSRINAIDSLNKVIGFKEIIQWKYKDNCLDLVPINELQDKMIQVIEKIKPQIIFTPSAWDFNFEHKIVFDIVEMSTKQYYSHYIEEIFSYEIPSSTDASFDVNNNFIFNTYYDIEDCLEEKLMLLHFYDTELHQAPHPRSSEYVKSLAVKRGGECGCHFAEGFHLLRMIR